MDLFRPSEYPGRLPEPVTLLDSQDPRFPEDDPNGVILTCRKSENAVRYQLLSGSDREHAIVQERSPPVSTDARTIANS